MLACAHEEPQSALVALLLEHGADAAATDSKGAGALARCCRAGNVQVAALVLAGGATARDVNKHGVLAWAVGAAADGDRNAAKLTEALLAMDGVNVDGAPAAWEHGYTPYRHSARTPSPRLLLTVACLAWVWQSDGGGVPRRRSARAAARRQAPRKRRRDRPRRVPRFDRTPAAIERQPSAATRASSLIARLLLVPPLMAFPMMVWQVQRAHARLRQRRRGDGAAAFGPRRARRPAHGGHGPRGRGRRAAARE